MVENRFNLGPYEVIFDYDECDVVTNNNIAVIKMKDHPDINMFVAKVPRNINRNELWKDTELNDASGTIFRMVNIHTAPTAAIGDIDTKITVSGHPGFSVFITNQEMGLATYRIGYWLEEDDAISVFAVFPYDSTFKDKIIDILTNHIEVNRA